MISIQAFIEFGFGPTGYLRVIDDPVGTVGRDVDALPLRGPVLDVVQVDYRRSLNIKIKCVIFIMYNIVGKV